MIQIIIYSILWVISETVVKEIKENLCSEAISSVDTSKVSIQSQNQCDVHVYQLFKLLIRTQKHKNHT